MAAVWYGVEDIQQISTFGKMINVISLIFCSAALYVGNKSCVCSVRHKVIL